MHTFHSKNFILLQVSKTYLLTYKLPGFTGKHNAQRMAKKLPLKALSGSLSDKISPFRSFNDIYMIKSLR